MLHILLFCDNNFNRFKIETPVWLGNGQAIDGQTEMPEVNNTIGGGPYSKFSCYIWLMRGSFSVLEL